MPARPQRGLSMPVEKLVRDVYGAMAEGMRFEDCLDVLAPAFGSHVTGLHTEDFGAHRSSLVIRGDLTANDFSALTRDYAEQWSGRNLWIERSMPGYLAKGYECADDVVGEGELLASPYYTHYLRQFDVRYGIGICLWTDHRDAFVVLALNHTPSAGPITHQQKQAAAALQPHLRSLYAIYRRLARLEEANGSLRACFDRLPIGMLVLDAEGRILQSNAKAEHWLNARSGASRSALGALHITDRKAHNRLRAALSRLGSGMGVSLPETILVPGPIDRREASSFLHLCALPHVAAHTLAPLGRVIGFVYEATASQNTAVVHHMLQGALGLTPAEARVALLLRDCKDPDQVSRELGISISTVRTHLQHLFRKTGVRRQSELIMLVDRLVSLVPI